jgi:hypothetical protein
MSTLWVERDARGKVKGVYANRQPGYADEELAANHPDIVAYLRAPAPLANGVAYDQRRFERQAKKNPIKALLDKEKNK